MFDPARNTTQLVTTDLRRNQTYILLYVMWSKLILFELIPYMTILICNIFIIYKIKKSNR